MATGMYGWRCPCGLDTVGSRSGIGKSAAVACWACKLLVDTGGDACASCGKPLERLDAPGAFVEAGDRAHAVAYWRARLFDDELRDTWTRRHHPQPPFPDDAMFLGPMWSAQTEKTIAYDAWFRDMFARWPGEKDEALAEAALVAEVEARIAPIIEERVAGVMDWDRKHRCPRCGEMSLTWTGVPFPI